MKSALKLPNGGNAASRLRQNADKIIDLWAQQVRLEVHGSQNLDASRLLDSMPQVLENLAQALEKEPLKGEQLEIKVARIHGRERSAIPQYSIDQMIFEYRLLRRTIFEVLEEKVALVPWERNAIIDAIEVGISEAAAAYADHQFGLREQFISVLAHDLRNPLSAAKTGAQMIQRHPDEKKSAETLAARIVNAISRADRLIQDLLDTNRIRAGESLPLKIESGDLREIVGETLDEISAGGDRLTEFSPGAPITGFWDVDLLKRAIENLVHNAWKYKGKGTPPKVTLTQDDGQVTIAVHNEGNPISENEQKTIFEPYHRTEASEKGEQTGWGIGLSVVRGVAESHKGKITVESSEELGTTFTITLPRDVRPLVNNSK